MKTTLKKIKAGKAAPVEPDADDLPTPKKKGVKRSALSKSLPGKSAAATTQPAYKPSLYLDGDQIPDHLKDASPGDKVSLLAHGKVISSSKRPGGQDSVSVEIHKRTPGKVKRSLFKKGGASGGESY